MASRCIKALNDLDAISDKVFYKYSKNRFKSEIEERIKASKSRVERSSLDQNCSSKTGKRRGSSSSLSSQETSESSITTKARATKSAPNPKISHPQLNEQKERAKTTSYSRKRAKKTASFKGNEQTQKSEDNSSTRNGKTPSVYGKPNQEEEKSNSENWFNFEDGAKMGRIDSFVCDERQKKALCYTLNKKEAKPVPKLLRHRLEVRIGQNGEVRDMDDGAKENDLKDSRNTNMGQAIPLSWEEQLNMENACIKSPRPPPQKQTEDKGLCETHPVIFHPQGRPSTVSSNGYDVSDSNAAYRMYLDRRLMVSDRGNLVCGGKCITSVEIEDVRDEMDEKKELKMINSSLKAYVVDDDRMDMSTTIRNIENIYPRRSAASKSNLMCSIPLNGVVENSVDVSESCESNQDIPNAKDNETTTSTINKRVSFKDQIDLTENGVRGQNENIETVRDANVMESPPKERPTSSKERGESSFKLREKPKRPYTAPPCSPRPVRDVNFEKEIATHFKLAPIRVPTSEVVLCDQDGNKVKEEKPFTEKCEDSSTLENDSEVNFSDKNYIEGQPAMRVSVACKSAPIARTPRTEEPISRSLSSTSCRTKKKKYVPPQPVAVLADSSMELPPNLPPAQALVELRKKIRQDLAKETADLQLDIQQLYLKHHASS